jgi:5-methylcytosine-specific restriction endonuclease McrA
LDGESCFWCGNKILKTQTAKSQQLIKAVPDTIRDLNKDGSRILWNHVAACSSCLKQRYLINEDDSIQEWSKYCQEHYQFNINKLNGKLADYRTLNSWYTYFKHCKQQAQFQQKMDSLKDQATRNNRVPKQDRTSRLRGPARRSISERLLGQEEQTSCVWCQETLNKENITIDHIIPRSAGGSHWIKNTLPSCKRCNNDRGDLPADKYLLISKNARIDAVRERLEIINDPRMRQNHWQENHVQYGKLANKNKCSAYLIT